MAAHCGLANRVYLMSEFRMQSRQSCKGKKGTKAGKTEEQQYEINPQPVFVNSASNDTVIYVESKRQSKAALWRSLISALVLLLHKEIRKVEMIV